MECEIVGVTQSSDRQQVMYHSNNPKASYSLVSPIAIQADYNPAAVQMVDSAKVDYDLAPKDKAEHTHIGLPLSYLHLNTVPEATQWFKDHTRYPDMVCEMLARYEFGELSYTTKKEFRNMKKKANKKKSKEASLQVKKGNILVKFD